MTRTTKVDRTVLIAFGLAIVMLLVVGALAYRSRVDSHKSSEWVQHTQEVLNNVKDLSFSMEAISSSIRRYVITGVDIDLTAYEAAKQDLARLLPVVKKLTSDNAIQQERIPFLEKLIDSRIVRGESIIALRREKGIDAAMESVPSDRAARSRRNIRKP